jgi:hypothetical protein
VSQAPDDLEGLLRRVRPAPREEFVRELERSLTERCRPRQRPRRELPRLKLVAAGCAFASVLAILAVGLSLAGLLPLTSSGTPAQAHRNCTTVLVQREQRVPQFVRDKAGVVHVHYRTERQPRLVRRCR